MRHLLLGLGLLALVAAPAAAQFTAPTVFVIRVGADNSVTLRNFNPTTAAFGADLLVPNTDTNALTMTPGATSEGALTVSPNGRFLGFAGFRTGTNMGTTDRVIGRYDVLVGSLNTATAIPNGEAYGTSSIRSAVWTDAGDRFWSAGTGTGGGTRTNTFGAISGSVQVSSTPANTRVIGINNGQLYATAMSGSNVGFNQVGTGLPTTTGNTTTLLPNTGTSGTNAPSPYGFVLSPNGLSLYLADDRSLANGGGIQKWTRLDTSSPFTLTTTFDTGAGARSVAVDFRTANPTVYATTAEATTANRFISFIDMGIANPTITLIDTANTNTIYRGVVFSPVPEPAAVFGVAAGLLGLARVIRRRRRAGAAPAPRP